MLKKLKDLLVEQLKQGLSTSSLAKSVASSATIAIIPIIGSTTFLCLLVGGLRKLNQPVMQLINYLLYPLQIVGIPVFLYFGEFIVGAPHLSLNMSELTEKFTSDWQGFFAEFGWAGLHALIGWALVAPLIYFVVFKISFILIDKLREAKK